MLEIYRIRKSKDLYNPLLMHNFIEVEKNRWIEIESLENVTKASIEAFLEMEEKTGIKVIGFTEQSFQVGTIKDWDHSGWIK